MHGARGSLLRLRINMREGFNTDIKPIPDMYLLNISRREWHRRLFEKNTVEYLQYKKGMLESVIRKSVENGMSSMTYDDSLKLSYRIKALSVTTKELDFIFKPGDTT